MITPFSALALLAAVQAAAPAPLPTLPAGDAAAIRCSVAFAHVANGQAAGEPAALAFPALDGRGKEFFVRSIARLMEDPAFTRERVQAHVAAESQALRTAGPERLDEIMPACLLLLEASGL